MRGGCWNTAKRSPRSCGTGQRGASSRSPRSSGAPTSIFGTLTSARLAGLMEWQGKKYPATQWPAIIDMDTHERPVKLFADPARRKHVVRAPVHLLSGIATCPKCGRGLHYRRYAQRRAAGI